MNILISYCTNSGSTYSAVNVLSETLLALNHTVNVKEAIVTTEADFQANDAVILATPSWDYQGKEGQPLEDMMKFVDSLNGKVFEGKYFAILGTGDSSYSHFCGAVDVLEPKIERWKGKKVIESLKIDSYYTKPDNPQIVADWAKKLSEVIIRF